MATDRTRREELWRRYIEESRAKLDDAENWIAELRKWHEDPAPLEKLHVVFHDFAGSGALYAAPRVSSLGGDGEYMCYSISMAGRSPSEDEIEELSGLVRRLRAEFQDLVSRTAGFAPQAPHSRVTPLMLAVAPPFEGEEAFQAYFAKRGVKLERTHSLEEARQKLRTELPDMALVAGRLPDGSGYEFVGDLRVAEGGRTIPVLLLGDQAGFTDKMEAIRSGVDAFVPSPPEAPEVYRKVKSLLGRRRVSQSRILVVEDDPSQARLIEQCLHSAGYSVHLLTDPQQFDRALRTAHPHLILMDVLLPGVSGYDLVRYLRQEEGFTLVPVIFLTTEGQRKAQILGSEAGGDDYLVKPVSPEDLLVAIRSRLIRYRSLQEMMERDELTALLAPGPFLQQARLCLNRYARRQVPYALVLMQVDGMAGHVTNFGLSARDHLLQALSRFLQQRLRQTDILGRHGAEVVGAVLEHLSDDDAVRLMRRLQKEFEARELPLGLGHTVRTSFCAGIAMVAPSYKTLKDWLGAATDALAQARSYGPGRTFVAGRSIPEE
jgi:diguanylate cyclase (GGDEF)-like protein